MSSWAALAAIFAVAATVHVILALALPAPFIVPDELIYSEVAKSLGDGSLPSVRDETYLERGVAYPLLIAPMWAAFEDVSTAYTAAKVLNSIVMSLTAVPAFFLARRFATDELALLVAALSVATPSLLYSGMLMTEVALYPAFALAVLAMAVSLDRPTIATQSATFAAITLAFVIKPISVVLLAAYPASIVLRSWLERRGGGDRGSLGLARFRLTWLTVCALAIAVAGAMAAGGRAPHALLGTYTNVIDYFDPLAVPRWILAHAGELVLAVAVIPFAATLAVTTRGLSPGAPTVDRRFASLVAPVAVLWLAAVGVYASVPFLEVFEYPAHEGRLQGRATFMLAPLFFLGLVIWLRRRAIGRIPLVAVLATVIVLPSFIPLHGGLNPYFQALPLVLWDQIADAVWWPLGGVAFAGAFVGVWALAARRDVRASIVLAPIAIALGMMVGIGAGGMQWRSEASRAAAAGASAGWVDAAVPEGHSVSVLWAESGTTRFVGQSARQKIVFLGEFFNRSVGRVFEIGPSLPYALPATRVRVVGDRLVDVRGRNVDLGSYVLMPCYVKLDGELIARDGHTGAHIRLVDGPARVEVADPASCAGES